MIYFIEAVGVGSVKIGFTDSDDAEFRLACLQTGSPVALRLIGTIAGTMEDEKNLHRRFGHASIHGEWFRPVPELMEIINPKRVLACEGVEVVERSVSIRVLTVGRKQFSKSLFDQIPEAMFIDWRSELEWCEDQESDICFHDLIKGDTKGVDIWGWVTGKQVEYACTQNGTALMCSAKWIVYTKRGRLFKWGEPESNATFCRSIGMDQRTSVEKQGLMNQLFHAREAYPGYRAEDQLFFGI